MANNSSGDVRLLPIYAPQKLSAADWGALRSAALSLGKDYSIKPVRGVYGSPGYILAIGDMPDFVCDGVVFVPNTTVGYLATSIDTTLEHQDDGRVLGVAEQLSRMFGGKVVELEPERVEQKVAFK